MVALSAIGVVASVLFIWWVLHRFFSGMMGPHYDQPVRHEILNRLHDVEDPELTARLEARKIRRT